MTNILAIPSADALYSEWLDWIVARSAAAQYHWDSGWNGLYQGITSALRSESRARQDMTHTLAIPIVGTLYPGGLDWTLLALRHRSTSGRSG